MDGKVLDEKEVSVIATLPSLEEARAKIVEYWPHQLKN